MGICGAGSYEEGSLCSEILILSLLNNENSLPLSARLMIYKMCVLPILLYRALIWSTALARAYHRRSFQTVQNRFLRIILGKSCITPTAQLHLESNMLFIYEKIRNLVLNIYKHDHPNLLVRNIGNYDVEDLPFRKIRCLLPGHII